MYTGPLIAPGKCIPLINFDHGQLGDRFYVDLDPVSGPAGLHHTGHGAKWTQVTRNNNVHTFVAYTYIDLDKNLDVETSILNF